MNDTVALKNLRNFGILVVVLGLVVITVFAASFTIREGRQAIITQFGKPVRTVQEAGLHWKLPFVQEVREIDLRILNWDGYPNQIPTRDKKYILVDTTARWRIMDPLKFIQTVQSETGAKSRLDAILDAATRDVISANNLVEAVRNSNAIFDVIKQREEDRAKGVAEDAALVEEEEITGEIEPIAIGREQLSAQIIERAELELAPLGIDLIDVQLRSIMYEDSVQEKVYQRMISERQRVAEKIRSIGKGEQRRIEGKVQEELQKIESEAFKEVQEIKGQADARATKIYGEALGQDASFYEFTRKLELYKKSFRSKSAILLSPESDLFDVLKNGDVR